MTGALPSGLFIGGAFVPPRAGGDEPVINPATEAVIGEAPVGDVSDAVAAIDAAQTAFQQGAWRKLGARGRVEAMWRFHDHLMDRADEICALIVAEAGATASSARGAQFLLPMKHFRYQLDMALRDFTTLSAPEITPGADGRRTLGTSIVHHAPIGMVAAITPYNYPFMLNLAKIVPALLMGNSVVLKPSPYTPFESLLLGEAAIAAGLPDGVLNIITGGLAVGTVLTTDPRIGLITFTGSDTVGAAIMAQAAPTLKRLVLELGGKSAMIVRPDADLKLAAFAGLTGFTSHAGQGCALLTRHVVHNSVRADYVARIAEMAKAVRVGDPAVSTSQMGPLIRGVARDRTEHYVQTAIDDGARLVAGGRRPPDLKRGFFYEPTLFDDVDNAARIAQEEVFGPIGVVIGYDTDEEAVRIANDSAFGLNAAIFTADAGKAYEMALEIDAGNVGINGGAGTMLSDAPFGGNRRSGFGRENGQVGLLEFTNARSIAFHAG